jgi:phosphatidylserine/phosphatidylglycerophosphate/cardiolipin synthase-like enzyme/membrane-associated phospholipid phosphatase
VTADGWFLTAAERGNRSTAVDVRDAGLIAWTIGNRVRPLVHGAAYFTELLAAIRDLRPGDHLFFTDWRGDADERLAGAATEVAAVLADAAARGVVVRGLLWRSHTDALRYHQRQNRSLGEQVQAAGGECLLDMRVRPGGSHHQKLVVLRHHGRPERDVAYVGGIDLCHGRKDDQTHRGDEQPCPLGAAYGSRPAWHDVQVAVQGPAVVDFERTFRERWEDPGRLTRSPYRRWRDRLLRPTGPALCPTPSPAPAPGGTDAVQVLRTFPYRRRGYAFAPGGERSIARAHLKALTRARRLVYLEDQYIWSPQVVRAFADALADRPGLRLIAVLPHHPDRDSTVYNAPQLFARAEVMTLLRRAGGERVAFYGLENDTGTPVYVHAKVTVIDDVWCTVGSDNLNLRSWTYDSEMQQPWGRVLLGAAAAGLAAFALYELAAAAYRREVPASSGPPAARVRPLWMDAAMVLSAAAGIWAALAVLGHLIDAPVPVSGRGADEAVVAWLARHRTPVLDQLSAAATVMATSMTCITVTAVVAVGLVIWRGRWREPAVLVLAGTGYLLIAVLATATVDRMPPAVAQLDPASSQSSFPSVHAGVAVALYGCVAVIALRELRTPYRWWPAVLVAIPCLVGLSQLYRGTSFPSDVFAGAAAAAAWIAVLVAIVLVPTLPAGDVLGTARPSGYLPLGPAPPAAHLGPRD